MMRGDVHEPGQKPGQLSDANFLDLLRVVQLALIRGQDRADGRAHAHASNCCANIRRAMR